MIAAQRPYVSFVLATHNRRAVVMRTLSHLPACGLERRNYEVIVVDNASTDGTSEAVRPEVDVLIRRRGNAGSCAKAFGVTRARGQYIVFLDDDSFPRPGSVDRMLRRFEADQNLAAAGFAVHLPDGQLEGSALPGVFIGCGVGLRADALRMVGGLDRTFFMQAEEYDLSFRLVAAGWKVAVFDDLQVDHLKTSHARANDRVTYCDIRNNLRVVARYLPSPYFEVYRQDWRQRYGWLAERNRQRRAFEHGARAGHWRSLIERQTYRRHRLSIAMAEQFFCWDLIEQKMSALAQGGVQQVVFADLGKNVFAFHRAAKQVGIDVLAIGDDRFAAPGRCYRGIAVQPLDDVLGLRADAMV
ncbi:MAG: glycosyltransferase, partial [Planctomycetes bacterium]|nr:glycosyltransferase [Planctomycetota bacterium]